MSSRNTLTHHHVNEISILLYTIPEIHKFQFYITIPNNIIDCCSVFLYAYYKQSIYRTKRYRCISANIYIIIIILINLLMEFCCCQLLINVQNQGDEIVQEKIISNISEDVIILEFQKTDGTLITQLIDFRNEVRILKALVLGEEERNQKLYQVMCFITKLSKGDFIPTDAMSKLRQKNPNAIRIPEEHRKKEVFNMTAWVHVKHSTPISKHITSYCSEAEDAIYVRNTDLEAWSQLPGASMSNLEAATEKFPDILCSHCSDVTNRWAPCLCDIEICIGWYPCDLKYCKSKESAQNNYRCGIKTCRKCSQFNYYVRQKLQCLWNE